jgi:hypothetical protein
VADRLDEAVPVEHGMDRALGRNAHIMALRCRAGSRPQHQDRRSGEPIRSSDANLLRHLEIAAEGVC